MSLASALLSSKQELKCSKKFWEEFSNSSHLRLQQLIQTDVPPHYNGSLSGEECFRIGTSKLYEFTASGRPILVLPSMINKAYIMDLLGKSFIKALGDNGFRAYVIEWGDPGDAELNMNLNDFALGRVERFVEYVIARTGMKPILLGFCMGGIMAALYASKAQGRLEALVQLATPWDFNVNGFTLIDEQKILQIFEGHKSIPKEFFQISFYLPKFAKVNKKYLRMSQSSYHGDFYAIESWVHDGVDMPKMVFAQIMEIANQNKLMSYAVKDFDLPVLSIVATKDSVVPYASSEAIKTLFPSSKLAYITTGHVGLVTDYGAVVAETIKLWILKFRKSNV
ncbi:MAG: alpha/beta fold hydrolase [Candidatus Jidaibacter sp.]|nr:alpha/beta fold hydrolase [Candidatus Jidaibacter sp.]